MLKREISDDTRRIAHSAARWLTLIESGEARESDHAALQRWRDAHTSHEHAWQKIQALRSRFGGVPPELAMASLDRPDQKRRRLLKGLLGVATLAPAAWLVSHELPIWRADLATRVGEQRRLTLVDGSVLDINTDSALNLDVAQRRLILLRGEVALRLAAGSPFVIETDQGKATLSTGEICVRQQGDSCQFSMFTGVGQLQPNAYDTLALQAGQRLTLRGGRVDSTKAFDMRQLGWRDGVLMANNQPLGDFLRELERYRPGVLRWSPTLERLRVTGSFRLADTDQVLDLLAASLPLSVQKRTRYWVTLVPREKIA
ncbi:FecR family protein [Pseudomonas sp. AG1028]|uniref:FecR domain-containing protein n=1 Tax=Pseudomonas sp. AG1028 TaxID=2572911 RepID=UPI0011ACFB9C|nr:FecR domain-containing protein [Pseudomonas sp. AG1028]TWE06960.1 FecR family protein [Pseudomonas sp. AG1028]